MSLAATSTSTSTSGAVPLDYPKDFFTPSSGTSPKNEEEARKLWPFRKARPQPGLVDVCPPNGGEIMLRECADIRASLHKFVIQSFIKGARTEAEKWKVRLPSTNDRAVSERDLIAALGNLRLVEGSRDSELKAYMVGYHFNRQRSWLARVVDEWCLQSNIRIMLPARNPSTTSAEKKRQHQTDRGGFAAVARIAKCQIQKRLMNDMLRIAKWGIGVQKKAMLEYKTHERICFQTDGRTSECYLVTSDGEGSEVSIF